MKLYYAPGACSLSVHIALIESGLPYQLEEIDLKKIPHTTTAGTDYTTINPKGSVPALQLPNDEILTEGAAILQYIADQAPEKKLAPSNGSLERYRLMECLNFIATEIHKGFGPLWNPNISQQEKELTWQKLGKQINRLNKQLNGKEYLLGNFSIADCYAYTCLNWTNFLGLSLDEFENIKKFMGRMTERTSVQQALREENLI